MAMTWHSWKLLLRKVYKSYLFCSVAAYICLALFFGAVLYGVQKQSVYTTYRFIDTLFSACSTLTVTGTSSHVQDLFAAKHLSSPVGLITIDTAQLSAGSRGIIFLLMLLGSTQLMSAVPVLLRSYYLRKWLEGRATQLADQELIAQLRTELRALNKLRFLVVGYFLGHVIVGGLVLSLYNRYSHDAGDVAGAIKARGINPWFAGYFLAVRVNCSLSLSCLLHTLSSSCATISELSLKILVFDCSNCYLCMHTLGAQTLAAIAIRQRRPLCVYR